MTLQSFLTPLSEQLNFILFSAITGMAYVLIWVVSLRGLLRPDRDGDYYRNAAKMKKESVAGVKGSKPLGEKRKVWNNTPFQRAHTRKMARITRDSARAA